MPRCSAFVLSGRLADRNRRAGAVGRHQSRACARRTVSRRARSYAGRVLGPASWAQSLFRPDRRRDGEHDVQSARSRAEHRLDRARPAQHLHDERRGVARALRGRCLRLREVSADRVPLDLDQAHRRFDRRDHRRPDARRRDQARHVDGALSRRDARPSGTRQLSAWILRRDDDQAQRFRADQDDLESRR